MIKRAGIQSKEKGEKIGEEWINKIVFIIITK